MLEFLKDFVRLGIDEQGDVRDQRYLVVTNIFSFSMALVSLLYVPIFYFSGFPGLALMAIPLSPIYAVALWLNFKKKPKLAVCWIKLSVDLAIYAYSYYSGYESYIHFGFFMTLALPFILLPAKHFKLMIGLSAVSLIGILSELNGFGKFDFHSPAGVLQFFVIITVFILLGICLVNLSRENEKYQGTLRAALQLKQNLLNMIGHDLNNPLSIALGNALILDRKLTKLNDQIFRVHTVKMLNSLRAIDALIENVRTLQAVHHNKLQLRESNVNIKEVFENLQDLFSEKARIKDVHLNFKNSVLNECWIPIDKDLLTLTLIANLISNALKFSHEKGVVLLTVNTNDGFLVVTVKDNGVGIPKEKLTKIWVVDGYSSSPGTLGERGTGFGLPLVKSILDLIHGKIEIKSSIKENESRGTTVKLFLPMTHYTENSIADELLKIGVVY